MTEKTIILGSASPRRRELLAQIGADFEVRVSNKEEIYHSNVPEEIVKELALMKAENVAEELAEENPAGAVKSTVVIGADTIVVLDGKILGKPADEADAVRMLSSLVCRGAGTMSIPESLFLTMMKTEKSVSIIIRWGRPCM